MKPKEKRKGRVDSLYQKALSGKFTNDGKFSWNSLVDAAEKIGVSKATAVSYSKTVIEMLQSRGHLK